MKQCLLLTVFLFTLGFLSAQTPICDPDPAYIDSTGVFPKPFDPVASPNGGINVCAVVNEPFTFTFTVGVGDTLIYQGLALPLDSVVILGVSGLPAGINYGCSPAICHYKKNTTGCASLYGTPTGPAGLYDLQISGKAYLLSGLLVYPITFPDANLAPGKYTLEVLASASDPCSVTGSKETLADKVAFSVQPNPASGKVQAFVSSKINGRAQFVVADFMGKQVYSQQQNLVTGANSFDFDGSNLPDGMYFLSLKNELGTVTQKLIVQH